MKKVMFIPSHLPQSEMFRSVADELLKLNEKIRIQVVDIHPQHQGITAFGDLAKQFTIVKMLYKYSYVGLGGNINISSRFFQYINLAKKNYSSIIIHML